MPERIIDVDLRPRRKAIERFRRSRVRDAPSLVVVLLLTVAITAFASLVLLTAL
jgi:hypothetical protein